MSVSVVGNEGHEMALDPLKLNLLTTVSYSVRARGTNLTPFQYSSCSYQGFISLDHTIQFYTPENKAS